MSKRLTIALGAALGIALLASCETGPTDDPPKPPTPNGDTSFTADLSYATASTTPVDNAYTDTINVAQGIIDLTRTGGPNVRYRGQRDIGLTAGEWSTLKSKSLTLASLGSVTTAAADAPAGTPRVTLTLRAGGSTTAAKLTGYATGDLIWTTTGNPQSVADEIINLIINHGFPATSSGG